MSTIVILGCHGNSILFMKLQQCSNSFVKVKNRRTKWQKNLFNIEK